MPEAPLGGIPGSQITAAPLTSFLQRLGLDLNVSGTAPFEVVIGKIVDYFSKKRETMSISTRDRWDNLELTIVENWHDGIVDLVNKGGANFRKVKEDRLIKDQVEKRDVAKSS